MTMTQAEQVDEMLKQKAYRRLKSPRLKPTPDLTYPSPALSRDELDEAKLIYEYEQELQVQRGKRGY